MPPLALFDRHVQNIMNRLGESRRVPWIDDYRIGESLGRTGICRHDQYAFPVFLAGSVLVAYHIEAVLRR